MDKPDYLLHLREVRCENPDTGEALTIPWKDLKKVQYKGSIFLVHVPEQKAMDIGKGLIGGNKVETHRKMRSLLKEYMKDGCSNDWSRRVNKVLKEIEQSETEANKDPEIQFLFKTETPVETPVEDRRDRLDTMEDNHAKYDYE